MNSTFDNLHGTITPPEMPLFSATLTPNRSLGQKGTFLVVGAVTVFSLVLSVPFIVLGAWPISGLFGLDVAALVLAFHLNNRAARRYEEVRVSRIELLFRQICWRGQISEQRFNPFWVSLKREEDPDYGLLRLAISQGKTEVDVGAFLSPVDRAEFASALQGALADVKRR